MASLEIRILWRLSQIGTMRCVEDNVTSSLITSMERKKGRKKGRKKENRGSE